MQALGPEGAADYLGITVETVKRRIQSGTFPLPDYVDSTDWWELKTLDNYKRRLAYRKAHPSAQRRTSRKRIT